MKTEKKLGNQHRMKVQLHLKIYMCERSFGYLFLNVLFANACSFCFSVTTLY